MAREVTETVEIPAELLADAIDSLERVDCQFWACKGPTLTPEPMKTCHRCDVLARLAAATGHKLTCPVCAGSGYEWRDCWSRDAEPCRNGCPAPADPVAAAGEQTPEGPQP